MILNSSFSHLLFLLLLLYHFTSQLYTCYFISLSLFPFIVFTTPLYISRLYNYFSYLFFFIGSFGRAYLQSPVFIHLFFHRHFHKQTLSARSPLCTLSLSFPIFSLYFLSFLLIIVFCYLLFSQFFFKIQFLQNEQQNFVY